MDNVLTTAPSLFHLTITLITLMSVYKDCPVSINADAIIIETPRGEIYLVTRGA